MPDATDVVDPISTAELQRRWALVRAAMEEQDIDVLLMQGNNACYGGYVKWFSDIPALYGMYMSVLFPRSDRMTIFRHGPPADVVLAENNPIYRGARKLVTRPTFAASDYTKHYHTQATIDELRQMGARTIGLVNTQTMAYPYLDSILNAGLPNVRFVDATDLVDRIKAIKSAEEIGFIKRCAAMQDAAMAAVIEQIKPGMRVADLAARAQFSGETMGSLDGLFLAAAGPLGSPAPKGPRHLQNRILQEGDQFTLLIENNGPNGFYCELGRTFVLGKAPQYMHEEFAFVLEAQRFALGLLKPGADPAEIIALYNDFLRKNGRPEENRLFAHGQGYDLVERPMIVAEETMKLAAGMSISVHPTYSTEREYAWVCDNYLVAEGGVGASIHSTPQRIFEV